MSKVLEIDCITGQQVLRDMNVNELAQFEIDKVSDKARTDAQTVKNAARQILLNRLGITADEAALLLN